MKLTARCGLLIGINIIDAGLQVLETLRGNTNRDQQAQNDQAKQQIQHAESAPFGAVRSAKPINRPVSFQARFSLQNARRRRPQ